MKLTFEILGIILAVLIIVALVRYFIERRRQQKADREGVVVYASVLSIEPVGGLVSKLQPVSKIRLRLQEPGSTTPREVTIRTRVDPSQKLTTGTMLIIVIDPTNPDRVYPASEAAGKRVVVTGSRLERRTMQSVLRSPARGKRQMPNTGYQPPLPRRRS